jgi:YihY family inner membrane protein
MSTPAAPTAPGTTAGTPAAADPVPPGWLDRFDDRLQRHRPTAVLSAVLAKWYDDGAGRLANLMAYSAFLAVFPLLLILLTLVEILLVGHKGAQQDVIDAALRQFPEIGSELRANINGLGDRSAVFLVVVLLWLVYGCLRLSRSAQILMATVWSVPREALPTFRRWLPRAVGFLVVLGVGFIGGGVLSGVGTFGGLGPASALVGFAASLGVNVAMFWAGFTVVLSVPEQGRTLWRGALVAGAGWTVLQFVDTLLVNHELRHYRTLYGAFATFIVLVWWIGLGTLVTAFAAELDVVVQRRLWPRSLRRGAGRQGASSDAPGRQPSTASGSGA